MVTIKDVARVSGVSKSTVSEVLRNGHRPVSEETRKRVLEAAQQLDYQPNALARGLVGKRMNTVGLAFTHLKAPEQSPFILGALLGVLDVNGARNQKTTLFSLDYAKWAEQVPEMCDGRYDGMLLMVPPEDCPLPEALLQRKMPCVVLSAEDPSGQAPSVDVDNQCAAVEMTNALLQMGHRRIGYVHPGEIRETSSGFARKRHEGYCQALKAAGAYDAGIADLSGEGAAIKALQSSHPPTAFFCLMDAIALTLMEQLQRIGVRVPEDVSVAGFDDIPAAATSRPALSTVRQPIHQLGERAAELLQAMIEGVIPPGHRELLPTELVLRGSTAPPRS